MCHVNTLYDLLWPHLVSVLYHTLSLSSEVYLLCGVVALAYIVLKF